MSVEIIIIICILLILAYVFDVTSQKTKIPSVVLLLILGYIVNQVSSALELTVPNLTSLLPILGTIGLILIVLEGALDIEINPSKLQIIKKSLFMAFAPMVLLACLIAFGLHWFGGHNLKDCFTNAIPLCVISSAIAIPTASNLDNEKKEFVVYESSLSDILGVIFFNFLALNVEIDSSSVFNFILQLIAMLLISFIATAALSFLLSKIKHHIKFGPIIILVVLIYAIAKIYHLPALIFILLFGLFLGNLDALKGYKYIKMLNPEEMDKEVHLFKDIVMEATFLIRTLFFLLFGFLIQTSELINPDTLLWSVSIVIAIYLIRYLFLKMVKLPTSPLLYISPRGLITILLFLSILPSQQIPLVNRSLIIQVIIFTAFIMMFGMMFSKKEENTSDSITPPDSTTMDLKIEDYESSIS